MAELLSAAEAVAQIPDGATVAMSGVALCGFAVEVANAIEDAFLAAGHPRDLTLVHAAGIGNFDKEGMSHLGHEGLVAKWIGGHTGAAPGMAHLIEGNHCQAYCVPQGVAAQLYREIAAHRPGVITHVGIDTFVDPRLGGGRMNEVTTEEYVKIIEIEGREYLFYPSFPIDVAVIRGTVADELGNITMDDEAVLLDQLPLAQAARNSGGIVIAQVRQLARARSLHPKHVRVPAPLVDVVVIASSDELHPQTAVGFKPGLSGDLKVPLTVEPLPMGARAVVVRRAAMELVPGAVVNLGTGYPDAMGGVAAEEGVSDLLTLTTEVGTVGGMPGAHLLFGTSCNPEAFVEEAAMFDWYDGGGLDLAFLGLAQTDQYGNVNVSRFSGRDVGPGGFINITQSTKTVIYCGSFTAGGLEVSTGDGRLRVLKEGRYKKFLRSVQQITFSGAEAARRGQRILYVTERAVFELRDGQMTLIEIAPGVDLERDVLAQMEFAPVVAQTLELMPDHIFYEKWGKLRSIMAANRQRPAVRSPRPAITEADLGAVTAGV
ncbi:MAG: acyl CoA:acetate/3-ketoacid CoA transferase [Solirubrobacteraceae bacterium]